MREFKEIKGACLTTWNQGGGGVGWVRELGVDDNIKLFKLNNKLDYI